MLFLVCSEMLAIWGRNYKNLQGIPWNSLFNLMSVLDRFNSITGLVINRNKSEVVALRVYKAHPPDISSSGLPFSVGPFKTVGILFPDPWVIYLN